MKAFFSLILVTILCVCCQPLASSAEDQPANTAFQKARLWNNGLPADGCDYRISLQVDTSWVDYAPDTESRALIEKFALANLDFTADYHGYKEVQIKAVTNKSLRSITCGWGGSKQLPGVSVSEIRK